MQKIDMPELKLTEHTLDPIEIVSGTLYVTDPCYTKDQVTQCTHQIDRARKGLWNCVFFTCPDSWGSEFDRVSSLVVSCLPDGTETPRSASVFSIGVDSGQAGIFCHDRFPDDGGHYNDETSFYKRVCNLTTELNCGAIDDVGFVANSGYGDGGYDVTVFRDDAGEAYAVELVFIDDDIPDGQTWVDSE